MVRSSVLFVLVACFPVLLTVRPASASPTLEFYVETIVPQNGGSPSITVDQAGRPWVGFSVGGTMQFAVRAEHVWSFETVPFEGNPKTGIVVDSQGSPAVAHWGPSGTLHYVYRDGEEWVDESTHQGFFPEASALAVGPTGRPYIVCVWSYHNFGYVTLAEKIASGWHIITQWESVYWFNPIYAGADLAVDGDGNTHAIVNPIHDEFHYYGPGDGAPFPDMEYFAIAVNSQNQPLIVYNVGTDIQLMTRESGLWALFTVATVEECAGVDIAVDGDDVPHVAYCGRPGGVKTVVYAFRGTYGETWQFYDVGVGSRVSIAVDAARHPHVAYLTEVTDPVGYDLKYATTTVLSPVKGSTWGSVKTLFNGEGESD